MKIGVFDSGIGGEAVADALRQAFPNASITTINDKAHVPYGSKSQMEVIRLTEAALQPLLNDSYDVIVIACNTATAFAIDYLRTTYREQKFIGIEPMIKSAVAMTKNKKIAVCATTGTLSSGRYRHLVERYASDITVLQPDCNDWADLIENNAINRSHVESVISDVCNQGADVIVLGCTHYHWIKDLITEIADERAVIIEPSEAIGRRVKELLGLG